MPYESEKQTRKKRINQFLRNADWTIIPFETGLDHHSLIHHAVEEYLTANGPANYALFVKGHLLGIVEAKKLEVRAAANGSTNRNDLI